MHDTIIMHAGFGPRQAPNGDRCRPPGAGCVVRWVRLNLNSQKSALELIEAGRPSTLKPHQCSPVPQRCDVCAHPIQRLAHHRTPRRGMQGCHVDRIRGTNESSLTSQLRSNLMKDTPIHVSIHPNPTGSSQLVPTPMPPPSSHPTLPLLVGSALALGAVALSCLSLIKALGAQRELEMTRRKLKKEVDLRKMERYVHRRGGSSDACRMDR